MKDFRQFNKYNENWMTAYHLDTNQKSNDCGSIKDEKKTLVSIENFFLNHVSSTSMEWLWLFFDHIEFF